MDERRSCQRCTSERTANRRTWPGCFQWASSWPAACSRWTNRWNRPASVWRFENRSYRRRSSCSPIWSSTSLACRRSAWCARSRRAVSCWSSSTTCTPGSPNRICQRNRPLSKSANCCWPRSSESKTTEYSPQSASNPLRFWPANRRTQPWVKLVGLILNDVQSIQNLDHSQLNSHLKSLHHRLQLELRSEIEPGREQRRRGEWRRARRRRRERTRETKGREAQNA